MLPRGWGPDSDAMHRNRANRESEQIEQPHPGPLKSRRTASTETPSPTSSILKFAGASLLCALVCGRRLFVGRIDNQPFDGRAALSGIRRRCLPPCPMTASLSTLGQLAAHRAAGLTRVARPGRDLVRRVNMLDPQPMSANAETAISAGPCESSRSRGAAQVAQPLPGASLRFAGPWRLEDTYEG